jgi:peptidoglycan/xylan/chitin deacetylase (PgdA/CDA1 family)
MLLAVNFHYVEPDPGYPYPAIFPTPPEQLARQLEALAGCFSFVGGDQLLDALEGKRLPERACVITFDDGLRSQFENALPVLDRFGVPALFFATARPIVERRAALVHKIHYVRANVEPRRIVAAIEDRGRAGVAVPAAAQVRERAVATYRYDLPEAAVVKWYLNFGLAPGDAEEVVAALFAEIVPDEGAWCERTYMSRDQIRALAERRCLGSHGWSHRPLAILERAEMVNELRRSQSALEELGGAPVLFISYPYGGENAVGPREEAAAGDLGFRIGFTMERALNSTLARPLLLARLDTNDALGGKHALMVAEGAGFAPLAGLAPSRERYFEEVPG